MGWILNRPRDAFFSRNVPNGKELDCLLQAAALVGIVLIAGSSVGPILARFLSFDQLTGGFLATSFATGSFLLWRCHRWWSAFVCAFFGAVIFCTLYQVYIVPKPESAFTFIAFWPFLWLYSMGPLRVKPQLLPRR